MDAFIYIHIHILYIWYILYRYTDRQWERKLDLLSLFYCLLFAVWKQVLKPGERCKKDVGEAYKTIVKYVKILNNCTNLMKCYQICIKYNIMFSFEAKFWPSTPIFFSTYNFPNVSCFWLSVYLKYDNKLGWQFLSYMYSTIMIIDIFYISHYFTLANN